MDFCIEKYILSDPILLIQAAQIRPLKNFLPGLPFVSSAPPVRLLVRHSIAGIWSQLLLSLSCFHCLWGSSL